MIHDLEPYQTAICVGGVYFLLVAGLAVKRRAWPGIEHCFAGISALVGFYGAYDLVYFAWTTRAGMTEFRALWLTFVSALISIESAKYLWRGVLAPRTKGVAVPDND